MTEIKSINQFKENDVIIKIKLMDNINRIDSPLKYMKKGDACADIRSAENVLLKPGDIKIISTGFAMALPPGYEAQIRPRSGLSLKGLTVMNSPGTIDAGYRGPVGVILAHFGKEDIEIKIGDRIAQLSIKKVLLADFVIVEVLDDSDRGSGGFGHTGHK